MNKADELIKQLQLTPHPEGGHYRETFRDIDAVEIWHWYAGYPLALRIAQDGGRVGERSVNFLRGLVAARPYFLRSFYFFLPWLSIVRDRVAMVSDCVAIMFC
jgi:hypothetical protein